MNPTRLGHLFAALIASSCAANPPAPTHEAERSSPPDGGSSDVALTVDASRVEASTDASVADASPAEHALAAQPVVVHRAKAIIGTDTPTTERRLPFTDLAAREAKGADWPPPLPSGITYIGVAINAGVVVGIRNPRGTPPPGVDLDAVARQAANFEYLWLKDDKWYRGTLGDALFPLDTAEKVALFLYFTQHFPFTAFGDHRHWAITSKGNHFEVVVSVSEQRGPCPHSNATESLEVLSVQRHGRVTTVGRNEAPLPARSAPCVGRDTEGSFRSSRAATSSPSSIGEYFAALAIDEATSIESFERLAGDLVAAHAPSDLVERALEAARDEARHAGTMRALAKHYGSCIGSFRRSSYGPRSVEALLLENATEGCVNETYAALVATRQAVLAEDPVVRKEMRRIAADETRHAELAWDIHHWGLSTLNESARKHLLNRLSRAFGALERHAETRVDRDWHRAVGEPDAVTARILVANLWDQLHQVARTQLGIEPTDVGL